MTPLISKEEIARRISEVASDLDKLYAGKELVIVAIMKGSICLAADLIRALKNPKVCLECIHASSYGKHGIVPGELYVQESKLPIEGKHVLLIDDIFDSGRTLTSVAAQLQKQNPASLKTLVLLDKGKSSLPSPNYVLFSIEDEFVIGYGLDYKECYRGLSGIYIFKEML
ncbi:MAG: hypoxanthine-guanine phosphoribosyltransferase [Chlamydiota bacterium]|jgi:hypoxanthine phosphoribosyltransferase